MPTNDTNPHEHEIIATAVTLRDMGFQVTRYRDGLKVALQRPISTQEVTLALLQEEIPMIGMTLTRTPDRRAVRIRFE